MKTLLLVPVALMLLVGVVRAQQTGPGGGGSSLASGSNFSVTAGVGNVYNVAKDIDAENNGCIANGIFDNGAAISNMTLLYSNQAGGILQFNAGTYVCDRVINNPWNFNGSAHNEPDFHIRGLGPLTSTLLFYPSLNTNTMGCIDARVLNSTLEVEHIGIENNANTLTLISDTLSILKIHDCLFLAGSFSNNAIKWGDTNEVQNNTTNSGASGYGGVVSGNRFNNSGVGVWCGTYANGLSIEDNYFAQFTSGAPILASIVFAAFNNGEGDCEYNEVHRNTVEATDLIYGVWADFANLLNVTGNAFDDYGGSYIASVRANSGNCGAFWLEGNWNANNVQFSDNSGGQMMNISPTLDAYPPNWTFSCDAFITTNLFAFNGYTSTIPADNRGYNTGSGGTTNSSRVAEKYGITLTAATLNFFDNNGVLYGGYSNFTGTLTPTLDAGEKWTNSYSSVVINFEKNL